MECYYFSVFLYMDKRSTFTPFYKEKSNHPFRNNNLKKKNTPINIYYEYIVAHTCVIVSPDIEQWEVQERFSPGSC